jgi:hypothetical protein
MAEMGAEIIKAELAPSGGHCRTFVFVNNQRSVYFVQQDMAIELMSANAAVAPQSRIAVKARSEHEPISIRRSLF